LSLQIEPQIKIEGRSHILFDAATVSKPTVDLFSVESLRRQGVVEETAGGRGSSFIIRSQNGAWVLRHYRRGGLVGKVLNDQYLGFSSEGSRSWREWRLLHKLYKEGMPVPRPVAAAVHRSTGFYQADLITELLPETKTVAEWLSQKPLDREDWLAMGRLIARFHAKGVFHADLNAHNILMNEDRLFYLIDFDRGEIRHEGGWMQANLNRLHRSFMKLLGQCDYFCFEERDWQYLHEGYTDMF